jgi:hypothetical protein
MFHRAEQVAPASPRDCNFDSPPRRNLPFTGHLHVLDNYFRGVFKEVIISPLPGEHVLP